jgi:catechol 2,3-dioxygenase-like lactoylglutathione lyase family enzyme
MAYRFVVEAPEASHEDIKVAVNGAPSAQILIERHSRNVDPDQDYTELTVVTHTLDVVDTLYAFVDEYELSGDVYLTPHKGGRVRLTDYDPQNIRRLIQGDQYWYENTVARLSYIDDVFMEGGARVSDVPYGARIASSAVVAPAQKRVRLGPVDHLALRVRDIRRAEAFYQDFFGMDVVYRAHREENRWQFLDEDYDWNEVISTGVVPELVRLENEPLGLVLVNIGRGQTLHEPRLAYLSVRVPAETLNEIRGRALFSSFTVQEDSPRSFRFVDPFGLTWQLVAQQNSMV